jgi:hypothetical protein
MPNRDPVLDCRVVHVEGPVSTAGTIGSEWLLEVASDPVGKI